MSIIASIVYADTSVSGNQVSGSVYIQLRDAATGQLTNGNNVTVTYDMNINGTVTENTVTISGQSQLIYSGLLGRSDPLFFTKFQVVSVSSGSNPAPPVNPCDLVIDYIAVDKPESAPGSFDGQITINATSGYLPLQYSQDAGTTWQSSPVFTGLAGGSHQFDVK